MIRLPNPCLVVLVGPSGSGKSHWADETFGPSQVVSADRLRALVGESEHDQRAGTDAFAVLDLVLDRRLKRKLFTVVDTLGLDQARRRGYVALARRRHVPVVAVTFDAPAAECRARNAARTRPVPAKVLAAQLKQWPAVLASLAGDGFDAVHPAGAARIVHREVLTAPDAARRQLEEPLPLDFGLHVVSYTWPGGPPEIGPRLAAIAQAAEDAGFSYLSVMDHFFQIPVIGRRWEEMLDSWTTLAFIAGHTRRLKLLTLVTGVTYRNVAHLGKIAATLDVLSGGRAVCGIGAAWNDDEHRAYGWRFPPVKERYQLLEDALQLLPLIWGPGAPAFEGKLVKVPEAMCYPRPLQERIPIWIGGSGEKKTLRLVAKYADACNLFGDVDTVRHKVEVLHRHCAEVGRDPKDVRITQLSGALIADTLADTLADTQPADLPPGVVVGTVEDHIGRYRELVEAGVQTAFVRMPNVAEPGAIEEFGKVIQAFA